MDCKGCIWFKIYDFIFPDGTKTMTCEKYNKHLGFTSKKGQVKKVKHIDECRGNINTIIPTKGTEIVANKEGVYFDSESKNIKLKSMIAEYIALLQQQKQKKELNRY